jgi:branched-chain amino acid transport system substrate-binding protein
MVAAFAALAVSVGAASAQEGKVGLILPYTVIGAELAQQMDRAVELYLKQNAAQIRPYKITIIKRDSKALNGAEAKVASQELLTQTGARR